MLACSPHHAPHRHPALVDGFKSSRWHTATLKRKLLIVAVTVALGTQTATAMATCVFTSPEVDGLDPCYASDGAPNDDASKMEGVPSLFEQHIQYGVSPDASGRQLNKKDPDYWSYPLDGQWNVSQDFGKSTLYADQYHLGEDVPKDAGKPVKLARWGYVRFNSCNVNGFGGTILIESPRDYEKSTDPKKWKKQRVQVYGHLACDSYLTSLKIGSLVDRGVRIGTIGSQDQNGGWTPHLHYGVRKGPYTEFPKSGWGYTASKSEYEEWTDPSDLIKKY